ncbi:branched-chain amino acid ABC transporter permease [Comamonas sp.]|uniref:branched-chain amino acid ABC transporter permease n=1 Tax=Comamonas sp. TaxID=34028 RepID=UPI002898CFC2|nr:branched-chain amino acid ABC transporter permease [Comamonas sp.]
MHFFSQRTNAILLVLALVALLLAPLVAYPVFLIKLMCYALLAASVNLLMGYAGLLSFGHAMFFGTAGYAAAHAIKVWGWDGSAAILLAMLCAMAVAVVTGLLAIRRHGIYFSMITLAFSQVIYFFALRLPFTGGEDGIQNVPRPEVFGFISLADNTTLYYFAATLVAAAFWLIYRIVYSPFGQVLRAIRDSEARAQSLGYQVLRYKLVIFVLSAALAGLAGALKVITFQLATLNDVNWTTSGEALLICIVGGLQTLLGPVIGAAIIVSMQNYLVAMAEWVLIIQGLVFVVVVMLFRKGIIGQLYAWLETRQARQAAPQLEAQSQAERQSRSQTSQGA